MRRILFSAVVAVSAIVFGHLAAAAGEGDPAPKKLTGVYVEFCSCERVCEAAISEPGKRGPCAFVAGLQIDAGQSGGVSLGGIAAAVVSPAPGSHDGKSEAPPMLYIDRGSNEAQREILKSMLGERFGARLGAPLGPPRLANVKVTRSTEVISLSIEGVADLRGRPAIGTFRHPVQLTNAGSTIGYPMLGRGTGGQVADSTTGVRFDAEGRSILFGKFDFGGTRGRR